jgi:hypothetical protein
MAAQSNSASTSGSGPTPNDVRRQVDSIVDSRRFRQSHSLVKFLQFAVEETLEGRGDALKEYLLGVEVFGRGADFDPKLNNIVRVQAGNLRSKLSDYYANEGRLDPVAIELPRGRM